MKIFSAKKAVLLLGFMILANVCSGGFGCGGLGSGGGLDLNGKLGEGSLNSNLAASFERGGVSLGGVCFADEIDYKQTYLNMQVPAFSYIHGVDPGQYYDNKDAAYSIYPLFRLSSPIYFKSITIMPGYYDLTPVLYKENNYLLFKEAGIVKYTVPVYKKELVPEDFYDTHLPKPKYTRTQRMSLAFGRYLGKHFKCSQRKPPVKTYLEVTDLDNNFVSIIVYYGNYRYYTLFRTVAM